MRAVKHLPSLHAFQHSSQATGSFLPLISQVPTERKLSLFQRSYGQRNWLGTICGLEQALDNRKQLNFSVARKKGRSASKRDQSRIDFTRVIPARASSSESMAAPEGERKPLLVYGATGHTGKLVIGKLKERGLQATLAGRSAAKLKEVAESAGGLAYEAVDLQDTARLDHLVAQHSTVLHLAGPFTNTGPPMVRACLKNGAHYLDITGETEFVRWVQSLDQEAKAKGVMLMPAVGYDVVPQDCLAAHLKGKLPSATHLDLVTFVLRYPADQAKGSGATALPSHGTLLSGALHIIPHGGLVKRNGTLVKEGIGRSSRQFQLRTGEAPFPAFSFPAAELVCTDRTTGIPNITTYFPGSFSLPLRLLGNLGHGLINFWPIRSVIEFGVHRLPQPDESKAKGVNMWGSAEVRDVATGQSARASVVTGPGYPFTASSAVEIASRVLAGNLKPGYQTPAMVYGPNLVLEIPGEKAEIIDLP